VLLAFCHLSQNAQVSRNLGDFDEVKVLIRLKVINSSFGKQDCYYYGDRSWSRDGKNGILKLECRS
jgi:hypothetical protein